MYTKTTIQSLLVTILFFATTQGIYAQNFTLFGDKTFGGNKTEDYCQVLKFSESKLVIAGGSLTVIPFGDKTDPSCNYSNNNNNYDIWMVMVDTAFNILWNVSLGGEESDRGVTSLVKTMNNEIIFVTASRSDSSCEKSENAKGIFDYWVCKVDSNGNKLWDKTFGSPGSDDYPSLIQLSTGDFVVGGKSGGAIGGDKTVANYGGNDFWVVKFDTLGNKIWDNVYGGSGPEIVLGGYGLGQNLLCADADGSFVLTGRTNSPVSGNVSSAGYGDWDIWIIKVDSTGNKIWDKRYGSVGSNCQVAQCIKTNDGYLLLAATADPQGGDISDPPIGSNDLWLLKLDTLGNKVWDKRYGGTDDESPVSISEAPGGGYWICANTNSPVGFDVTEPAYGTIDYWMLKIDSAGSKLWDKRLGGPSGSSSRGFVLMADSSIFLCGQADSGSNAIKTDSGNGESDFWMVHFIDKNTSVGIHPMTLCSNRAAVFPNPAIDFFTVDFSLPTPEKSVFSLYNFLGENLLSENINKNEKHLKVTTLEYSEGVYFWKLTSASQSQSGKIVLIK